MKKNFAYETYKKVEAASNYKTADTRNRYIRSLESRTREVEMPFLRKHLPKRAGRVLEIGSGSGRILHALIDEGRARSAVGIEISPSRTAFGRRWAKEKNIKGVEHITGDILALTPKGTFDVILCMTSIFPFFDMFEKDGLQKMITKSYAMLNPGGYIVLETSTFATTIKQCKQNGGDIRLWEEYRNGDPFRFHLMEFSWDEKKRHLTDVSYNSMRERLFIDGPTIKKWHIESTKVWQAKLRKVGFRHIKLFSEFDSSSYKEGVSERIIFIARK